MADPAPSILIVDDSAVARGMARHKLLQLIPTLSISEGKDVESGYSAWRRTRPDLAILDLNMPGGTGLDLAERIRREDADARLILCTANLQDTVRARAEKLGMGFVNKPLTSEKLAEMIEVGQS